MGATALLRGLSSLGRRAASWIKSFMDSGFTSGEARRTLRDIGKIDIPRFDFNKSWSIIQEASTAWDRMKFVGRDKTILKGYAGTKHFLSRNFATTIRSEVRNIRTGEIFDLHTTVMHDEQLTRENLEDAAWDSITEGVSTDVELLDQRPVAGLVRA